MDFTGTRVCTLLNGFFQEPGPFWLTLTNVVLGAATLVCLAAVLAALGREYYSRSHTKNPSSLHPQSPDLRHMGIRAWDGSNELDEKQLHAGEHPELHDP